MSIKSSKEKKRPNNTVKVLKNELIVPKDAETAEFLAPFRKKSLPRQESPDTVRKPIPAKRLQPVPNDLANSPFLSCDDLKKLTNYAGFQQAVTATSNVALLKLAWEYAQQMKEHVEDTIKHVLWGNEIPEGQLRFNTYEKNGLLYINAHIGSSTRSVPREHIKALEALLLSPSQPEGFVERQISAAKSSRHL